VEDRAEQEPRSGQDRRVRRGHHTSGFRDGGRVPADGRAVRPQRCQSAYRIRAAALRVPDRYPIIDWRALESLGQPRQPAYTIDYWLAYVAACQNLAPQAGVTMRVLDKALWQYSSQRRR
jgi:hypothetical protein